MSTSKHGEGYRQTLPIILTNLVTRLAVIAKEHANATTIPEAARPVLLALHLVYPHIVLDALDLLDRQCVTRLHIVEHAEDPDCRDGETKDTESHALERTDESKFSALTQQRYDIVAEMAAADAMEVSRLDDDGSQDQLQPFGEQAQMQPSERPSSCITTPAYSAYYVRSIRPPPSRFSSLPAGQGGLTTIGYTIHLAAWNCSCPVFASMAFGNRVQASDEAKARLESVMTIDQADNGGQSRLRNTYALPDQLRFGFGGLDMFTPENSNASPARDTLSVKEGQEALLPVCCKHLLACVLAVTMPNIFAASDESDAEKSKGKTTCRKGVIEKWIDKQGAAGWAAGFGFEN